MRSLALLGLLLVACRSEPLAPATSSLRFELLEAQGTAMPTPVLTFPQAWADGPPVARQVKLLNVGTRTLEVAYTGPGAPFSGDFPQRVPPGETLLTVRFTPTDAGVLLGRLVASAPDVAPAGLEVQAVSQAVPGCASGDDCHLARFDPLDGGCVEEPLPDGTTCHPGTRCLTGASCQAGRCVGTPVRCDDGNACTVDVCSPETGCEHLPAPPCPGDGVCSVGQCRPDAGCGLGPAPDGTRCGPLQTCVTAQVCIEGACVLRQPAEGSVCEEASPCSDQGRCQASACVHQQPPWTLQPRWAYDSLATGNPDAGLSPQQYHDFVLEPSGELTLGGFFTSQVLLRANTTAVRAPSGARRCILWNGRLVCADYPSLPNGKVTALDLATGAIRWSYDARVSRPDFLALTSALFLARLVVQSPDRLAALYEAYPADLPDAGAAFCRRYFLIILDASGREVSGRPIEDPLLEPCNHPHPYGVAADSVGNLAIAFSPTISAQAPLLPAAPTLLLSFTRDGLFRWKRLVPGMTGGELAVARGLLYPENSPVVFSAATGEEAFRLPALAGRIVVADARHVPAPVDQGTSLIAYEAGEAIERWRHTLPAGYRFFGDQLRLATWATSTGPRTVALSFLEDPVGGVTRLHAVDVQNGLTGFSCQAVLPPRTAPQLFEVADGHLAVMGGALDPTGAPVCERCDPPMAYSSAAFEVLDLPGVTRAQEPWPGTFGGPSHDHQEKVRGPP